MPEKNSVWMDEVPDKRRYPALKGDQNADVIIIGAGIAGTVAAWNLASKGVKRIVILEKNHIATGDTSATTGFLTRVPDSSNAELTKSYGQEFLKSIFSASGEHQQYIFDLIRNNNIACDFLQVWSYYCSYKKDDAILKKEWECISKAEPRAKKGSPGTTKTPFAEAIQFEGEGKFHSRKFVEGVLQKCKSHVQVFEESEATEVLYGNGTQNQNIIVKTPNGSVTAKKLIVTIGNPSQLFPELGSVLHSKVSYVIGAKYKQPPFSENLFWDTLDPYFYYRKVGKDTIICGGCDIEFDKIQTQNPFDKLKKFLDQHFPQEHTITHEWSGSLFHTSDGLPYAFEHPHVKNVYVATGFGGNGLVFGSLCARIASDLALGNPHPASSLFSLARTKAKVPLPSKSSGTTSSESLTVPLAELKEKKPVKKNYNGKELLVVKTSKGVCALSNICTHAGGKLNEGSCDDEVVECPLHGARFNLQSGEVLTPPATRPLQKYAVEMKGDTASISAMTANKTASMISMQSQGTDADNMPSMKKESTWPMLLKFMLFAALFWAMEFALQYFLVTKGDWAISLLRSFSFSGATFFGLALFSSAIFKWFPNMSNYWRIRRYLGVTGFVFIVGHVFMVTWKYFKFDVASIYTTWNPLVNPMVFGTIAVPIFMIMALTSTDWAVDKLTPKWWKRIHRLVYIAYYSAIAHFILMAKGLLFTVPGYLLLTITALAVLGQIYWFVRTIFK